MLFTEIPFQQRFSEAAGCGFSFVEFWFPFEYGGRELAPVIRDAGVQTALFNLHPGDISQGDWGLIGVPGREDQFKAAVSQAVELAVLLGCKNLMPWQVRRWAWISRLLRNDPPESGLGNEQLPMG